MKFEIWNLKLSTMDFADDKLRRIAFHEAGHAWMMVREGLGLRSVSINPGAFGTGDNRGETLPERSMEEGRRDLAEKFARASLAGSAAEHFLMGGWDEEGLQARAYDTGRAMSYIAMSGDDLRPEALEYYIQVLSNTVMEEMSHPKTWDAVTGLAYALLERESMVGDEVAGIIPER